VTPVQLDLYLDLDRDLDLDLDADRDTERLDILTLAALARGDAEGTSTTAICRHEKERALAPQDAPRATIPARRGRGSSRALRRQRGSVLRRDAAEGRCRMAPLGDRVLDHDRVLDLTRWPIRRTRRAGVEARGINAI
jgi:hypothetical protein